MTEYALVHHFLLGFLTILWFLLAYLNVFIFFCSTIKNNIQSESSPEKRRDFLDPDFGIKTSLNLASKRRNKCRISTEADSEIPELGLDSGRLNLDCDLNPRRVVDAAARVALNYRNQRRHQPQGSVVKRKRTRINIDYEKSRNVNEDEDEPQRNSYPRNGDEENGAGVDAGSGGGDDDDDDD